MLSESSSVNTQSDLLPVFDRWFKSRGWRPRAHQLAVLEHAANGQTCLLIAPTGGGKTLAGFLPSLVDLATNKSDGVHTLYISPLKALAVDIARNLETPITEMGLDISVETRTGDTPQSKKSRQRYNPPDILITTPEQASLLIAHEGAGKFFASLKYIVLDELHALVASKRGLLLSLALSRIATLAPEARRIGLSATVAEPQLLCQWLGVDSNPARLVMGTAGAIPQISILETAERLPWSGHSARYAIPEIYQLIGKTKLALVFVNTRSQAERLFQDLWEANEDHLPIALHHGSLDVGQRRKVEAAMTGGKLRAVVCTSTLDLGIDWGDVDLVINVGAPKGSSRILQRIGRANHRLDEPSRAVFVPSNRFEVLECEAARVAAKLGEQDSEPPMGIKRDVLAQHIMGCACAGEFDADELFNEISVSAPWEELSRQAFDAVLDFVATGGYALSSYDQYAKLKQNKDGNWRLSHPRLAQNYRLNSGTIVEEAMIKVRLVGVQKKGGKPMGRFGGKMLGEVEEWFVEQLAPGDTFLFAGQILRFEGLQEMSAMVSRSFASEPKVPSFYGGKFPLSTYLAGRVRAMLADPKQQKELPAQVRDWLNIQRWKSILPKAGDMLVETFPRANKHYLVCYPFDGRLAHQTLGMLATQRLERMGAQPLGFVANDYALAIWCVRDLSLALETGQLDLAKLFDEDMLGDDLEAWLAQSSLMKRTFRDVAIISGLIERRNFKGEKTGRQMTVSSDLIYDVLRSHQPDHVLLKAAYDDAAAGLIDVKRLGQMLARIKNHIIHKPLEAVSPLAVPVMLEIGREPVYGQGDEALLAEAADNLIDEAMALL
ncbi:ATP-dependent, 3'-5' DNA helicase with strand annealing activity [hydrothermal vent metagenome]|uniref:ATP-dependent, 3'-5' DNA helicase with strand annealing activity n=1 Tax=hydrothermal vent metagenome TaxID=652676 RepID=A0A3B0T280_9ZZZZ